MVANGLRLVPEGDYPFWAHDLRWGGHFDKLSTSVDSAREQEKPEATLREILAARPREASCKGAERNEDGVHYPGVRPGRFVGRFSFPTVIMVKLFQL
ncbi:MAG: hypothetical protein IH589_11125 [Anaerolineales bacterium]|nr:hypothetical protein [Anaerolineales bacterium]